MKFHRQSLRVLLCLSLAATILRTLPLMGQTNAFTYQARLAVNGNPANGNFDFTFELFDAATNGNPASTTLTNVNQGVSNGLVTVTLSFGQNIFSGADRWLEIGVRPNGSNGGFVVLAPRQLLTPSPYATFATTAASLNNGQGNIASGGQTAIGGGGGNIASGAYGTIGGGNSNTNTGYGDTIGGGIINAAAGGYAVVGGGQANISSAAGGFTTVAGGDANNAAGGSSTIGGGSTNYARGNYSFIGGGFDNETYNDYSAVVGGTQNYAGGLQSFVGGGSYNQAGDYAGVGGGTENNAIGNFSFVGGGLENSTGEDATVSGGIGNSATGTQSVVSGGADNSADGINCAVGGGIQNLASNYSATVAGGENNIAGGDICVVAGGAQNAAIGFATTIGGGEQNTNNSDASTIAGGYFNSINSPCSGGTIGGGTSNVVDGCAATVPGGLFNTATGDYSFAAGNQANAIHQGAFVWGDSSAIAIYSTAADQFTARASGGVRFFSNPEATVGVCLAPGSGSWTTLSDRNAKENFQPVNTRELLEKVSALPVTTWNYKTQDVSIRHIGPTAQDFSATFSVGESDTGISTVDEGGVALAAIKGLNQKLEETVRVKDAQISTLQKRLDKLEMLLNQRNNSGR